MILKSIFLCAKSYGVTPKMVFHSQVCTAPFSKYPKHYFVYCSE